MQGTTGAQHLSRGELQSHSCRCSLRTPAAYISCAGSLAAAHSYPRNQTCIAASSNAGMLDDSQTPSSNGRHGIKLISLQHKHRCALAVRLVLCGIITAARLQHPVALLSWLPAARRATLLHSMFMEVRVAAARSRERRPWRPEVHCATLFHGMMLELPCYWGAVAGGARCARTA